MEVAHHHPSSPHEYDDSLASRAGVVVEELHPQSPYLQASLPNTNTQHKDRNRTESTSERANSQGTPSHATNRSSHPKS